MHALFKQQRLILKEEEKLPKEHLTNYSLLRCIFTCEFIFSYNVISDTGLAGILLELKGPGWTIRLTARAEDGLC